MLLIPFQQALPKLVEVEPTVLALVGSLHEMVAEDVLVFFSLALASGDQAEFPQQGKHLLCA